MDIYFESFVLNSHFRKVRKQKGIDGHKIGNGSVDPEFYEITGEASTCESIIYSHFEVEF